MCHLLPWHHWRTRPSRGPTRAATPGEPTCRWQGRGVARTSRLVAGGEEEPCAGARGIEGSRSRAAPGPVERRSTRTGGAGRGHGWFSRRSSKQGRRGEDARQGRGGSPGRVGSPSGCRAGKARGARAPHLAVRGRSRVYERLRERGAWERKIGREICRPNKCR